MNSKMRSLLALGSAVAACGIAMTGLGGGGIARWTNTADASAAWANVSYWTDEQGAGLEAPPLNGEDVQFSDMPAVPFGGDGNKQTDGTFPTFQRINTGTSATSGSASHAAELNPKLASVTGDERHSICIDTPEGSGSFYYPTGTPVLTPDGQKGRWFDVQNPNGFLGFWRPLGALARIYLTPTATFRPVLHNVYAGQRPVISVRGSETAEIGHVFNGGALEKVGTGRLSVTTTDGEGLRVYLKEGSLDLAGGKDSDVEAILAKAAIHFDASDTNSIVRGTSEDGATVATWYDVRGRTGYYYATHDPYDGTAYANKTPYVNDPLYAPGVSPTGLAMVDFGVKGESSSTRPGRKYCAMRIYPDRLTGIRAVFYVADHKYGLANTAVIGDHAALEWLAGSKDTILYDLNYSAPAVRYGDITVNRQPVKNIGAVDAGTFSNLHVLAQSTLAGAGFGFLCTRQHYVDSTGGTRVGEVIAFTNELTNVERARVAAYLDAKWRVGRRVADVDSVMIPSDKSGLAVSVPDGRSASVASVVAKRGFVKKGDGELRVGDLTPATAPVTVEEGTLAFDATDVDGSGETAAAGAYLWLDAGKVAEAGKVTADETTYVRTWKDCRDGNSLVATSYSSEAPHMPRLIDSPLCGRKVLDFGAWNANGSAWAAGNDGAWMKLPNYKAGDPPSHGAYHYFCVLRLKNESVDPSKNRKAKDIPVIWGNGMDVLPDGTYPLSVSYYPGITSAARWRVNGTAIDPLADDTLTAASATNGFAVLSIASAIPWHCDEICHERDSSTAHYNGGGYEVGELLLFDRPISMAEHHNIEAYLMEKWLAKPHPSTLPRTPALHFAETSDIVLSSDADLDVSSLDGGNGAIVKRGDGSVSATAGWENVSSVAVETGDLSLTVVNPDSASFLNEALFHFDASDTRSFKTFTVDANGVTNLSSWSDIRGNGLTADAVRNDYAKADPTVISVETRPGVWRPTVDFGGYSGRRYLSTSGDDVETPTVAENSAGMNFSSAKNVADAYTVFSDRPGDKRAWIFGPTARFMRSVPMPESEKANPPPLGGIFNPYFVNEVAYTPGVIRDNADVDGVKYGVRSVLSDGFHLIATASTDGSKGSVSALARGSAAGATSSAQTVDFAGGCRISETLAFDRVLTAAERAYLTAYLDYKWFEKGTRPAPLVTNVLSSVSVAGGSTLTLSGLEEFALLRVECLSGSGQVVCPELSFAGTLKATVANGSSDCLTIAGALTIDGPVTLDVSVDLSAGRLSAGVYPILSATSIEGFDPAEWTLPQPPAHSGIGGWKVVRRGNVICLSVMKNGCCIIVR